MRAIEDDLPSASAELRILYKHTGNAHVVGLTGAPGVGKSTLVDCLITGFRRRGSTVGVVAIDPTSPLTGGALLGDRVRMGQHATDCGVFIRSLASRGWGGGLARAAVNIAHVLDAMGKDVILMEAVGAGQGEVDISRVADTTLVVLSPGLGDEIQMMKAGILETADIFVVNKADRDGAQNLKTQIEQMLGMKGPKTGDWAPVVVMTQALTGQGVEDVIDTVERHKVFLRESGQAARRRMERARLELREGIEHALRARISAVTGDGRFEEAAGKLAAKKTDPHSAAESVLGGIRLSAGRPRRKEAP
jgi:LAO/AO transport system kinase